MRKTKETRRNKGVTLIALVVTILVLLILAGVSIATLTGKNGLITQAEDVKEKNSNATAKEKVQLEAAGSFYNTGEFSKETFKKNLKDNLKLTDNDISEDEEDVITVKIDGYEIKVNGITGKIVETPSETASVKPGEYVEKTEKNNYSDGIDKATIPQGFTVSGLQKEQTIANGLVIYDIPKDDVENVDWETAATQYNQFVWIPVTSANDYQRDFTYPSFYNNTSSESTPQGSTATDTGYLPSDMQPSTNDAAKCEEAERDAVLKYKGFYIARYEAGSENSNVVSKKDATVYTYQDQEQFKIIGKEMYGDNSEYVKSAMCSGIQWDMVMKFVNGKEDGNGNDYDVRTADPNRHISSPAGAGQNIADKVQNIYDLEGNCYEYVAEKNDSNAVFRGGIFFYGTTYRASLRGSNNGSANSLGTFRPVLYIK